MKVDFRLKPHAGQALAFIGPFKKKKPIPKPSGKPQIKHEMNLAPKKKTPGQIHRADKKAQAGKETADDFGTLECSTAIVKLYGPLLIAAYKAMGFPQKLLGIQKIKSGGSYFDLYVEEYGKGKSKSPAGILVTRESVLAYTRVNGKLKTSMFIPDLQDALAVAYAPTNGRYVTMLVNLWKNQR